MFRNHGHPVPRASPVSKLEIPEQEEEDLTVEKIRQAQTITGELLWLVVRTRPDLSYAVGLMGRNVSRNPSWAVAVGRSVLSFLAATPNHGLVYGKCSPDRGMVGLPLVKHERMIEACADISFNPQGHGGRSLQGIIVYHCGSPIQWEASRQAFVTMSTAESELVGYLECMQITMSVEALLQTIYGVDEFQKVMVGDSMSAISIIAKPDGSWRTRHLRLRSQCLKEKLDGPKVTGNSAIRKERS